MHNQNNVAIDTLLAVMRHLRDSDGTIIAAGSIVNKDVAPYSIVAGVPARFMKWRFEESVRERLAKVKWHEFEPDFLATLDIANIESCLDILEALPAEKRTRQQPDYTIIKQLPEETNPPA